MKLLDEFNLLIDSNSISSSDVENTIEELNDLVFDDIGLASKYILSIGRYIYKNKCTQLVRKFIDLCDLAMSVMTNEEVLSNIYKALIQIYFTIGLYSLAIKYCMLLEEIGLEDPKELVLVYFYTSFITSNMNMVDKAFYYNKKYYDTFSKNIKLYSNYDKILNNLIYLNSNVIISLISNDIERAERNYNKFNAYISEIEDSDLKLKLSNIFNYIHLLYKYKVNNYLDIDFYIDFIRREINKKNHFVLDKLTLDQHKPFIDELFNKGRIEDAVYAIKELLLSLDCTGNRYRFICKLIEMYAECEETKKYISLDEIADLSLAVRKMSIDDKQLMDSLFAKEEIKMVETQKNFTYVKNIYIKDKLTGCFNRYALNDDFAKYHHGNHTGSIGFIDLNNLKKVNDTLGHDVGDQFINNFATATKELLDKNDTLYRWGGDEFVILSVLSSSELKTKVEEIRRHCITVEWTPNFCYGISSWPDDASDFETLLKIADKRMYDYKKRRKNSN